jgi:uncharacterized small protein (DUF1192 family)
MDITALARKAAASAVMSLIDNTPGIGERLEDDLGHLAVDEFEQAVEQVRDELLRIHADLAA